MKNKGEVEWEVIGWIIGIVLLILVVGLLTQFDLVAKLKIIFPVFWEEESMLEKTFQNQNGRCKPLQGAYSLNNGNLERWEEGNWVSLESELPKADELNLLVIQEQLSNSVIGNKLDYNGKEYDIEFVSSGFMADIDGANYVYVPLSNLFKENALGELDQLSLNDPLDPFGRYPKILGAFQSAFLGFPYSAMTYYNRGLEESTLGQNSERIGKVFTYKQDPATNEIYGIDYTLNLYKKYPSPNNLISDWRKIEDLPDGLSVILFKTKVDLIERCK